MCRFCIYVGEPIILATILTHPKHSIVKQAYARYLPNIEPQMNVDVFCSTIQRNSSRNLDGFGIGWYTPEIDKFPCIFTSTQPVATTNRNFVRLVEKIKAQLFFAHIRAASPNSPITETNCHPFQFGRFMWMHNGGVFKFEKLKKEFVHRLSTEAYSMISGTTDSEHLGALFIDQLPEKETPGQHSPESIILAMKKTIKSTITMVKEVFPSAELKACSLNCAVTDGKTIVVSRFRNSFDESPPSLYYCLATELIPANVDCKDITIISAKENSVPKFILISSEPVTHDESIWKLVPPNHIRTSKTLVLTVLTDKILVCIREDKSIELIDIVSGDASFKENYFISSKPKKKFQKCASYA